MGHIHRLLGQSADQSVNGRGPATRVTRVPRVPRKRAGVADDHLSSIAATRAGLARASSAASPVRASRASVARRLPTEWRAGAPVLPVDIVSVYILGRYRVTQVLPTPPRAVRQKDSTLHPARLMRHTRSSKTMAVRATALRTSAVPQRAWRRGTVRASMWCVSLD